MNGWPSGRLGIDRVEGENIERPRLQCRYQYFFNYLGSLVSLNYKSMKETRLTDEIITAEQMKVIPENYK